VGANRKQSHSQGQVSFNRPSWCDNTNRCVCDSSERARNKVAAVYDDVKMDVEQSYAGYASAARWR